MAELHLERKERPIWPWIIAALVVLALLIWFFMLRGPRVADTDVDTAPPTAAVSPGERVPGAVGDYQEWVRGTSASADAGREHDYTAAGIRHLANAIPDVTDREAVSDRQLGEQLDRLRSYADSLQNDAMSLAHAGYARSAFLLATELLEDIDRVDYAQASTGTQDTRTAAERLDANVPLLQQLQAVERFFENVSTTLAQMTRARDTTATPGSAPAR